MMPGMTGDELARQLRQTDRGLKVLYLTGYSDRLFKEKTRCGRTKRFSKNRARSKGLREAVSLLVFGRLPAGSRARARKFGTAARPSRADFREALALSSVVL